MKRTKIYQVLACLFVAGIYALWPMEALAATRYVNADSSGAANNPTRAFNADGYAPNDSYKTLAAAYAASANGDIIELSGGTTGKSYQGIVLGGSNKLIRGSQIPGHNGPVTITYNPTNGYALSIQGSNNAIQDLIVSGDNTGLALDVWNATNASVTNVISRNLAEGGYGLRIGGTTNAATFNNIIIDSNQISTTGSYGGRAITQSSGMATFNNCVVNNSGSMALYLQASGITANFNNCVLSASSNYTFYAASGITGAVVNTSHSLIQGGGMAPQSFVSGPGSGGVAWNSNGDILNGIPSFTQMDANMGYVTLSTDDGTNINYFKGLADYAMSHYGMPMTLYVSGTQSLSASDVNNLQTLYTQGDEIGLHTRHHTNLGLTAPIKITYSGSGTGMAAVVSAGGTSFSITGSAETHGAINLTSTAYDTVGELCALISTWAHFACALTSDSAGATNSGVLSGSLKDVTTSLTLNTAISIPYDDSLASTNRFYTEEITNGISDLETAMASNACCTDYHVKTMAFPFNESTTTAVGWIKANTGLIAARASSPFASATLQKWLGSIDPYHISSLASPGGFKPSGYTSMTTAQQQGLIEQAARAMATYASNGYYTGFLSHTSADLTQQEFQWFIDELAKYVDQYHITVSSYKNNVTHIMTSGDWTNVSGIWTRAFPEASNFQLLPSSILINSGTSVVGRTTDILNNSLAGMPDIGAYEFQAPATPGSVGQYTISGSPIAHGGWVNQTSIVLGVGMSSANTADSLAPQVELQPSAVNFTGSPTNVGTALAYAGSPVTGSIAISGLTDGQTYHWRARANNPAASGSWVVGGDGVAFGVDTSAPSGGYIRPATNAAGTGVALAVSDGNDSASGINGNSRIVQRRQATRTAAGCNAYGDWLVITPGGAYPAFSDTTTSGMCYQYRYVVSDNASNQTTYVQDGTITTAPLTPAAAQTVSANRPTATNSVSTDIGAPSTTVSTPETVATQSVQGGIVVVHVMDMSSKPVVGASVTLHSITKYATTDSMGYARFKEVAYGAHEVEISYAGHTQTYKVSVKDKASEPILEVKVEEIGLRTGNAGVWATGLGVAVAVAAVIIIRYTRQHSV